LAVIVDSSVWISASKTASKEHSKLKRLIQGNTPIFVAKPIIVEVCQGARTQEQFYALWDSFLGFDCLPLDDYSWSLSAWNYFVCKKAGLTISTIDCLIATLAKENRIPLWSLDNCFKAMRPILGFESYI
jgi:predicted nucleic acid-binding protein